MNGARLTGASVASGVDTHWHIAAVGDFNGDGKADLRWRYTDGSIAMWFMNGGSFTGVSVANGVSTTWGDPSVPD